MAAPDILFYTCANERYHDFAPLYACSVLWTFSPARVEFGVEGRLSFEAVHGGAVDVLKEHFGPDKIAFSAVPWRQEDGRTIVPNTVRFIVPPHEQAGYVYIGDIDIIFLDRSFPTGHFDFMARTGIPYSNSVRPGTKRMSGLHFTSSSAYYPLPDLSDIELGVMNDEEVLYEICRRKDLKIQDEIWYRPSHGIHVSPNRSIRGSSVKGAEAPGWGLSAHEEAYREFVASDAMRALRPYLSARVRGYLEQVEAEYGLAAAPAPLP